MLAAQWWQLICPVHFLWSTVDLILCLVPVWSCTSVMCLAWSSWTLTAVNCVCYIAVYFSGNSQLQIEYQLCRGADSLETRISSFHASSMQHGAVILLLSLSLCLWWMSMLYGCEKTISVSIDEWRDGRICIVPIKQSSSQQMSFVLFRIRIDRQWQSTVREEGCSMSLDLTAVYWQYSLSFLTLSILSSTGN